MIPTDIRRIFDQPFIVAKDADWTLKAIPADQIRSVWDDVRWFLEEVLNSCPDADTWIPEDVYHEVKAGKAFLYVVGTPAFGCLVLQSLKDQYTGRNILHVWIAYSRVLGAMVKLMPELDKLAKTINADRITCHSPFEAFAAAGFEKKLMIFERRI
jgi:hypothetical protein